MCRFVYYRGTPLKLSALVTEPSHSIVHQSYRSKEREEPLNGDGFGIAWYVPDESEQPALFKEISPAWNNRNLQQLARVIRSHCMIAHIRAATPGLPVSQLNCHPFSWNDFAFAHNGEIGGFKGIRRAMRAQLNHEAYDLIQGSTDSEHIFALFAHHYRLNEDSGMTKTEAMAASLKEAIVSIEKLKRERGVTETSRMNLILTDGDSAVVTRYCTPGEHEAHSLYIHTGAAYECHRGVCHMKERSESGETVLVASEPLSKDYGWRPVDNNTLLSIDKHSNVTDIALV
ncbi:MAG: class II glutamine amidotransferase [Pseudomonadota bacterium]